MSMSSSSITGSSSLTVSGANWLKIFTTMLPGTWIGVDAANTEIANSLDPLSSIIRLLTLVYREDDTKLVFTTHRMKFDPPGPFRYAVRRLFGHCKDDLIILKSIIIKFQSHYNLGNPKIKAFADGAIRGLDKLYMCYGHRKSDCILDCLEYYKTLIPTHLATAGNGPVAPTAPVIPVIPVHSTPVTVPMTVPVPVLVPVTVFDYGMVDPEFDPEFDVESKLDDAVGTDARIDNGGKVGKSDKSSKFSKSSKPGKVSKFAKPDKAETQTKKYGESKSGQKDKQMIGGIGVRVEVKDDGVSSGSIDVIKGERCDDGFIDDMVVEHKDGEDSEYGLEEKVDTKLEIPDSSIFAPTATTDASMTKFRYLWKTSEINVVYALYVDIEENYRRKNRSVVKGLLESIDVYLKIRDGILSGT
jgi:hypothetical protein